jgi:hypothetical protein
MLLAAACATQEQQISTASAIRVADDSFKPYREYSSGPIRSANMQGAGVKMLTARVDRKTGALTALLQFQIHYIDYNKRRYEQARNARAELLPMQRTPRRADCPRRDDCTYDEVFAITLPEADLRAAPAEGYLVKVFPSSGPEIAISVPKPVIVSLFERVDADRGKPSAAPAPAPVAARTPRG